jgi:endonuclease G
VRRPQDLEGQNVVVVGYPARDDRSSLELQDRIFARKYNVKRLQPGQIRARTRVSSFGNIVEAMTHDSSTLGGNSGSAILHVDTGEVVGLHFAGEYLKANYGVPAYELSRDRRVTALKVNFDGAVPAATNDWEPAWLRVEGAEGAAVAPPPVAETKTVSVAQLQAPAGQPASIDGSMTWTIPLRITVTLGQPATGAAGAGAGLIAMPGVEMAMQAPKIFGGLENRKGYQGGFLDLDEGEEVPLLALTSKGGAVVAKLEDGDAELRYHRFSVVMHKGRRIALFTASNVDWREDQRLVNGKKPSRKELTELEDNVAEQWVTDWRIASEHQLPDLFYTKDGGAFDKGHLVRRDDVCWGKNFKDIQKGNGDTYHTTNCSPQIKQFNQSAQGVDNWGDLENLIQKQTKAEKAIVFAGPAFQEDDPLFEGRTDNGRIQVRIPRKFWKVVVVKGASGPEAYGFVLEQDLSAVPTVEEFAVPKQWKRFMKSIAGIEEMLNGLATMGWLKKHDQFGGEEGVRISSELT